MCPLCLIVKVNFDTVNSLYCGHPWDHELVSLMARVRNRIIRFDPFTDSTLLWFFVVLCRDFNRMDFETNVVYFTLKRRKKKKKERLQVRESNWHPLPGTLNRPDCTVRWSIPLATEETCVIKVNFNNLIVTLERFTSGKKPCFVALKQKVSFVSRSNKRSQRHAAKKYLVFCIRFFSKTKHKPTKKNTEQCFSINLKATCENSGTFHQALQFISVKRL